MARNVGFDGMEVIINHDYASSKHLEHLQELQSIFPVHSIHAPFFDIVGWGDKMDQLKRCAELALNAEVPLINFHPPNWLFFEFKFWKWLKKSKTSSLRSARMVS